MGHFPISKTYFGSIKWLLCLACLALLHGNVNAAPSDSAGESAARAPSPQPIDFELQIRPLFNEHCVACHGGVKQASDLSFIHRDAALDAITPGDADHSTIIERVSAEDPDEVMPPPEHGTRLQEADIQLLRQWIQEGAKWKQPWAYEKPVDPDLPAVSHSEWCRQPLDRFVLRRLEEEGLSPSPQATASQWLRRVSFDLGGIPPSPEQVDAFLATVNRDGDVAYAKEVDRLLDAPGFGERWASVWLDQIRYADSRGLGLDRRREIWKYRDWVIQAFNDDMPFDEFTRKQIAGDLLPHPSVNDLLATAANRLTQSNEEGGTDDEEFRIAAVLDRVSTVWQTWQGVTFGCVQCHSHPYDPIQHEEFYQFAAFFNNTSDSDLDEEYPVLSVPLDPAEVELASDLDNRISALETSIWEKEYQLLDEKIAHWRPLTELTASVDDEFMRYEVEQRAGNTEFFAVDILNTKPVTVKASIEEAMEQWSALKLTALPRNPETGLADSEWGFVLSRLKVTLTTPDGKSQPIEFSRVIGDEPQPFRSPDASIAKEGSSGFSAYSRIHHARRAAFVLAEPVDVPAGSELTLVLYQQVQLLGAYPLVIRRGHLAMSNESGLRESLSDEKHEAKRKRLEKLLARRKKIASSSVPIMRERPEHLRRPTHVFVRGLFLDKGEEVHPNVPASLPPLPADVEHNRLALANWLVNEENPLTARVTVNRVWARLFGLGLVATEEDFGSSGERPSHPELLDHLAIRFQGEQQWSMKQLTRSLVLSNTYRQSCTMRPELTARDPQNRLLARGPRFRLSAEMVRDSALAASGLLSTEVYGPPVYPPIPAGVWKPFAGDKWQTVETGQPDRYRRSIYTYTKRSIPYPMFAAFDAPSREFCAPRRLRSNTPVQALMTLNDTTYVECSRALAERIGKVSADLREQLTYGFVAVVTRQPTDKEIAVLTELYQQFRDANQSEEDALYAVATALLNLDEAMSK